jgi:SAM-dependent methyltransferase
LTRTVGVPTFLLSIGGGVRAKTLVIVLLAAACSWGAVAQDPDELTWRAFLAWYKTAPASGNPLDGYAAALQAEGTAPPEVQRRMTLLARMLTERSDWIEPYFDKVFVRVPTGNPARDGFNAAPSAWLVDAVEGIHPGDALDAGMGQGRNAVYLALRGWRVTGFDISGEAVTAASNNARRAAVPLHAVKAGYADFDFGEARWDLIVLAFAWAPVAEPAFMARLARSVRPGGLIVFEHFIDDPAHPRPAPIHALAPGQLRALFAAFTILRYEELKGVGDWGGPGAPLVRMVARKPGGRSSTGSSCCDRAPKP